MKKIKNKVTLSGISYCSPRLAAENDLVLGDEKMGIFVRDWLKEEWESSTNPVRFNCQK